MMIRFINIILFTFSLSVITYGQSVNTIQLDSAAVSPKANLDAVSWIEGYWRGKAWGGVTEEIWSEPIGGSMMGSFKFISENKISFYEICTITEVNGSLEFKIKHFSDQLHAWEEKDEFELFKLVKLTDDRVYFEGFTLERISEDHINMYVLIQEGDKAEEVKFEYHRYK